MLKKFLIFIILWSLLSQVFADNKCLTRYPVDNKKLKSDFVSYSSFILSGPLVSFSTKHEIDNPNLSPKKLLKKYAQPFSKKMGATYKLTNSHLKIFVNKDKVIQYSNIAKSKTHHIPGRLEDIEEAGCISVQPIPFILASVYSNHSDIDKLNVKVYLKLPNNNEQQKNKPLYHFDFYRKEYNQTYFKYFFNNKQQKGVNFNKKLKLFLKKFHLSGWLVNKMKKAKKLRNCDKFKKYNKYLNNKFNVSFDYNKDKLKVYLNKSDLVKNIIKLYSLKWGVHSLPPLEVIKHVPYEDAKTIAVTITSSLIRHIYKNVSGVDDLKVKVLLNYYNNYGEHKSEKIFAFTFTRGLYKKIQWHHFKPLNLMNVVKKYDSKVSK